MPSRRDAIATAGSVMLAGLAGCSGTVSQPDEPPTPADGPDPDPESHTHGATGTWSSVGCNAANTREVADGQAPVIDDGVLYALAETAEETRYLLALEGA